MTPNTFNQWRVFPRLLTAGFAYLIYQSAEWYMGLPDPTTEQGAYAVGIVTSAAAWFKFYVESGNGHTK